MQLYGNKKNIASRPSRLRRLTRHHARELERMHDQATQRLVGRLQDIIFGLGLTPGHLPLGR